ncbi:MAG: hypothetical protein AAB799_00350, partial [Patescibacteria group bacterium]
MLLVAAILTGGCDKIKNVGGTGPSTTPPPDPNPSSYPSLPHRECAKNLETGEELPGCRMWAELQLGIKPARGSTVKVGDQYCPDPSSTCLEFDMKYGFKGIDNPNVGMAILVYWSMDGKTPLDGPISREGQMPGERVRHYGPWIWQVVPRYLLIRVDHIEGGTGNAYNP